MLPSFLPTAGGVPSSADALASPGSPGSPGGSIIPRKTDGSIGSGIGDGLGNGKDKDSALEYAWQPLRNVVSMGVAKACNKSMIVAVAMTVTMTVAVAMPIPVTVTVAVSVAVVMTVAVAMTMTMTVPMAAA